ncbi:alternative ribosome rescue factor ArfA [Colwellia sp. Arc7-D]|jgi:alternative ribosome-rescue factor|uniref:alternative ribosome rescue factor ArfA n=1 Tax=Colwellia sp. Arc7-D TaxID=2161872 RepID=UPI000D3B2FE9|nr:alternative ribosome rescue factor ArfA [Colwellia sp. Arc7-D]AWB59231.1 ribosome alternative rescue factor ArfA [Colwellia sp. Arc7-D]|tara:strand:+ start:1265 stop:1468 length:204 start_codon:yes stop_codon:yes gene_type:complete
MTKHKVDKHQKNQGGCELGRGVIKDNFLAAVVTSKLFKQQVIIAKKGKGAYQRTQKHKGQESYLIAV